VLARNWRCREGELDLVLEGSTGLVICEVKTRRGNRYGEPFEAVTATKQRRLRLLAHRWLSEQARGWPSVRFDVASVRAPHGGGAPIIDVIADAF